MTAPADRPGLIHLGGDAYAVEALAPLLRPASEFKPHPANPRRGDVAAITASIRDHGLYVPLTRQSASGYVLRGNHTGRALLELGAESIPFVDKDCDDDEAAVILARDNRLSDLAAYDDEALLALLTGLDEVGRLPDTGFTPDDLAALAAGLDDTGGPDGPLYTRRADAIHYEPKLDAPPPVEDLVDRTKAQELVADVIGAHEAGLIPWHVVEFLTAGAQRHLVFDYARIAEFYAHADPAVQRLMEASALVILDLDDAIHHGYLRLSSRLASLLDLDASERISLDGGGVNAERLAWDQPAPGDLIDGWAADEAAG